MNYLDNQIDNMTAKGSEETGHQPLKNIDKIDRNILTELQRDGRLSNVELSKKVGLSPTPCLERVRRLEKNGYILGYTARLNPKLLGSSVLIYIEVTLNKSSPEVFDKFNEAVKKLDEILECHLVSGSYDYLLKARIADMAACRKLISETVLKLPCISDIRTYVVMEEVKQSANILVRPAGRE